LPRYSKTHSNRRRGDRAVRHPSTDAPLILCTKKDVTHLKVLRDSKLMEARYRDRNQMRLAQGEHAPAIRAVAD